MPRGQRRRPSSSHPCPYPGCPKICKSRGGVTYHVNSIHRNPNALPQAGTSADPGSPSPSQSPDPNDYFDLEDGPPPTPPAPLESPEPPLPPPRAHKNYHPFLNARPCDEDGTFLPDGAPPAPRTEAQSTDWSPYEDKVQFLLADVLFRKVQMSSKNIDNLLEMWALSLMKHDDLYIAHNLGPFHDYKHIYETIDATTVGDAPWKCFQTEALNVGDDAPAWARQQYEVWYRDPDIVIANMLDNPDFDGAFNTTPYVHIDADGKRHWSDFMSANFAWRHCDQIYKADPTTKGAMYTPIFFGSDKTAVYVATGDVEYHPAYMSLGNPHNSLRRTHRNAVMPFAFLAIPKSDRKYDNDPAFRKFKRQLYHASLSAILSSLKPGMKNPVVRRCPDGHFRRVIYDFGPFIADYPEQVMLAGIVQNWCCKCTALSTDLDGHLCGRRTHGLTDKLMASFDPGILWDSYGIDVDIIPFTRDFPRADIHEMLSSDILHQIIKGSFKDHLVTWVGEYLYIEYSKGEADSIMDEIDRRIAATPAFPCLRHFKQGRRFKQWTGDDSKALMKVYLPAIKGLVPDGVVQAIGSFLDFCYLVQREDFYENTLDAIDAAVRKFHVDSEIFRQLNVRTDIPGGSNAFSLLLQHAMVHYRYGIEEYGAPGGKPWRRSSRYEALSQMLQTNQRLDKLAAARTSFVERGMLPPTYAPPAVDLEDDDGGPIDEMRVEGNVVLARTRERSYPRYPPELGDHIRVPSFPTLLASFLTDQLHSDAYSDDSTGIDLPEINVTAISVFHSAIATFYAPSDPSGICGMRRERIRSTPSWRRHGPRRDCAFAVEDQDQPGFRGMSVARVKLFFSFTHDGLEYPCALVEWFKKVGRSPDICTGMWVVESEYRARGKDRFITVVHLDSLLRGAHLIPVYGAGHIPVGFRYNHSLDAFTAFHVNKYIDHHSNEIAF
ncbi:hypothetical protein FB451DRAFT_1437560 [Mycena latifolia]|nr:hypothetical protein FB451DRAFT_1437560 [Mycena latifolia]